MIFLTRPLTITLLLFVITACTSSYIHKSKDLGKVHSLTMDASKRTILVNDNGKFCAEPSPDAVGTLAASFAAELSATLPKGKAVSGKISDVVDQNVAKLFERSQGIQALRDGMYRLCEAHLNDAIEKSTYEQQIIYLTATLNFVVPIELCTKVIRESGSDLSPESYNTLINSCMDSALRFATEIAETRTKEQNLELKRQREMSARDNADYARKLISLGRTPEEVEKIMKVIRARE